MNYEELEELAMKASAERFQKTFERTHELLMKARRRRKGSDDIF